jgi:hypothetical protein
MTAQVTMATFFMKLSLPSKAPLRVGRRCPADAIRPGQTSGNSCNP